MRTTRHAAALAALLMTLMSFGVFLTLPLASCRTVPPPEAACILDAMLTAAAPYPAGQVLSRGGSPVRADYLSDDLFSALLGPAARGWLSAADGADAADGVSGTGIAAPSGASPSVVTDAAVFLPAARSPVELIVLVCSDNDSAMAAAAVCAARLSDVRRAWQGTALADTADRGDVTVVGCIVLYAVVPDTEAVFDAARTCISRGRQ